MGPTCRRRSGSASCPDRSRFHRPAKALQQVKHTHLSKGKLVGAAEVRLSVLEEGLDLLHEAGDSRLGDGGDLGLGSGVDLEEGALELGEEGVDEEGDAGTLEGAAGGAGLGDEVRGVLVGEEGSDDAGLNDDLVVELEGGDKAAGVDGEVLLGTGGVEVDDVLLELEAELSSGDVRAVGPWGSQREVMGASCHDNDSQGQMWLV